MKEYSIFISSSDAYADLWPVFFDLFHKYWPQYKGDIYLNTESKTYQHTKLNIICTNVGQHNSFGKTFKKGLDRVETDYVLLMMIDHIFMADVNHAKMIEYFNYFKDQNIDAMYLTQQGYRELEKTNFKDIDIIVPPTQFMFSFQISFFKKRVLKKMVLPHENPWTSEIYGSKRVNKMKLKFTCISKTAQLPIIYDLSGCLNKGKWLANAKEHLDSINYYVDYSKRGFYTKTQSPLKLRIKISLIYKLHYLKGRYWALFHQ
ncbi:hypothetical protein [Polaribacter sp. Q13]|uniref:hypothetical protein n=1 Tax=Polaribacter sp. Q13 TaxID=2806551 RepID=UPI00193BBB43|nr:hypothetical protein [Polaribacter sp. Q13]QVY66632.1 hypothetical protein JOP69_04925 [Polaribacter sp. Q13]